MSNHVVFWLEDGEPKAKTASDLMEMLKMSEHQRKLQREGAPISHVTTSSEYADMVGEFGVSAPPADYHWPKRRPG